MLVVFIRKIKEKTTQKCQQQYQSSYCQSRIAELLEQKLLRGRLGRCLLLCPKRQLLQPQAHYYYPSQRQERKHHCYGSELIEQRQIIKQKVIEPSPVAAPSEHHKEQGRAQSPPFEVIFANQKAKYH